MTAAQFIRMDAGVTPEHIQQVLEQDGGVIINSALGKTEDFLDETGHLFAEALFCQGEFYGSRTKRIHGLIAKSQSCRNIVTNSFVFPAIERFLGRHANGKVQINLTQGIEVWPGERAQILHRDDSLFGNSPKPHEYMVNTMWACTKFTRENGATRAVPGSHKWPWIEFEERKAQVQAKDIAIAEMNGGDVFIWLGSLAHGGGGNITDKPRSGVIVSYSLPWLRQAENQYLAVPWSVAGQLSEQLQDLLGYNIYEPNLGMFEGNQPKFVLSQDKAHKVVTRDFLTPEQNDYIRRYYMASHEEQKL